MSRILVTGAFGLVGSDLVRTLQQKFGIDAVVAMARQTVDSDFQGILVKGDVRDRDILAQIIDEYEVRQVYHLAGLLSAGGEKNPPLAWDVNVNGLRNILDLAADKKLKVFWPSSIAAFGPTTPKKKVPQHTVLEPTTMYGVNKVAGELLCQYYHLRYGVDVRSLRYPGLLGYKADPGDGTTEYAIHMFYGAIKENRYTSYIDRGTILPMMYMDDAIQGTIQLMEADGGKLTVRTSYNFAAIDFAPEDLAAEIQRLSPGFVCDYQPDSRQQIAKSWPQTSDDSAARQDWSWRPQFDLRKMTEAMFAGIKAKLEK